MDQQRIRNRPAKDHERIRKSPGRARLPSPSLILPWSFPGPFRVLYWSVPGSFPFLPGLFLTLPGPFLSFAGPLCDPFRVLFRYFPCPLLVPYWSFPNLILAIPWPLSVSPNVPFLLFSSSLLGISWSFACRFLALSLSFPGRPLLLSWALLNPSLILPWSLLVLPWSFLDPMAFLGSDLDLLRILGEVIWQDSAVRPQSLEPHTQLRALR